MVYIPYVLLRHTCCIFSCVTNPGKLTFVLTALAIWKCVIKERNPFVTKNHHHFKFKSYFFVNIYPYKKFKAHACILFPSIMTFYLHHTLQTSILILLLSLLYFCVKILPTSCLSHCPLSSFSYMHLHTFKVHNRVTSTSFPSHFTGLRTNHKYFACSGNFATIWLCGWY